MQCFARLVRLLLGPSALSNNKLGFGPALEILGVQLFLSEEGYTAVPSKKTMKKCLRAVQKALAEDVLPGGAAQKLAGRPAGQASTCLSVWVVRCCGRLMTRSFRSAC